MTTPDRPLFTAEAVEPSKPSKIAIDLARHEIIEKSPAEMAQMIGRLRFIGKLGTPFSIGLSRLPVLALLAKGTYEQFINNNYQQEVFLLAGLITVIGSLIHDRFNHLRQKADTLEVTLNSIRQ